MHCRGCAAELLDDALTCDACGMPASPQQAFAAPRAVEAPPEVAPAEEDTRPRCADHPEYPQIGTCARCGKFICVRCAPEASDRDNPRCEACVRREDGAAEQQAQGLGGWLVLLAINLVLGAVGGIGAGIYMLAHGAATGVLSLVIGVYALVTCFFFFGKKRIAPLLLLGYFGLNAVFSLVNIVAQGNAGSAGRLFVTALWIFYVLSSTRVKNTFVR